jgi:hypothetical protein
MPPSLLLKSLEEIFGLVAGWGYAPVIAGGLAVSYWGHPRSTQDIDLAILVSDEELLHEQLTRSGLVSMSARQVVNLRFVKVSQWLYPVKKAYIDIEVDFLFSESRFHQLAVERAVVCNFPGVERPLRVLSCEDLLLFKAASGRLIDQADIQVLLTLHSGKLDWDHLNRWAKTLGIATRWQI